MNFQYAGVTQQRVGEWLELHYLDDNGPIAIRLPRKGIDHMCGQSLAPKDIETVMLAHEQELRPLFDAVHKKRGGYTDAIWESGVGYRCLEINMADIEESGVKLSATVLAMANSFWVSP